MSNALGLTDDVGKGLGGCATDMWGDQDFECRTGKIIPKIIASNYDVIALNEVFDEDARELLVKGLSGAYPYYVEKLELRDSLAGDAGLMLFSRWPFDAVDPNGPDWKCLPADQVVTWTPRGFKAVAFHAFKESSLFPDNLVDKGVGFARVVSPSGRKFSILFSHLQASYGSQTKLPVPPVLQPQTTAAFSDGAAYRDHWLLDHEVRRQQLKVIADLGRCIHNDPSEVLLVAGDFNVLGDLSNPLTAPDDSRVINFGRWREHNRYEWDLRFNRTQPVANGIEPFFFTTVEEGWTYSMTPPQCQPIFGQPTNPLCMVALDQSSEQLNGYANFDRGFTWAESATEERLDYIFLGSPRNASNEREFCIQHMSQAWNLNDGAEFEGGMSSTALLGASQQASDHMGLNAEIDLSAPACNPSAAIEDPTNGSPFALPYKGAVQWFKLTKPGTYTIRVNPARNTGSPGTDNELDYRVYSPTDLSRPVAPYKGEVQTVPPVTCVFIPKIVGEADGPCIDTPGYTERKFKVAEAPLYVKVFHPGDTYSAGYDGKYQFVYHRNTCTSQTEACEMLPFETKDADRLQSRAIEYPSSAPASQWFSIQVEASDSAIPQALRLFVTEEGATQHIDGFDVLKEDGTPANVISGGVVTPIVGSRVAINNGFSWEFRDESGALDRFGNTTGRDQKYYVRVNRLLGQGQSTDSFKFWVGWETSLTWIYGPERGGASCMASCNDSQDWGEDEIYMRIEADGVSFPNKVAPPGDAQSGVLVNSEFDEGESVEWSAKVFAQFPANAYGTPIADQKGLKFSRRIKLELIEDDPENDETSSPIEFQALGAQLTPAVKSGEVWSFGDDNYYRSTGINLSHHSPGKRCSGDANCTAPMRCRGSICR